MKHTPGPWRTERRLERHDDSTLDRPYFEIWLEDSWKHGRRSGYVARVDGMRDESQQANARLIAAAPELLEALKGLLGLVCTITGPVYSHGEIHAAEAALAKAEGPAASLGAASKHGGGDK